MTLEQSFSATPLMVIETVPWIPASWKAIAPIFQVDLTLSHISPGGGGGVVAVADPSPVARITVRRRFVVRDPRDVDRFRHFGTDASSCACWIRPLTSSGPY